MLNLPITEGELTFLAKFVNCAPILLCGRIAHTACAWRRNVYRGVPWFQRFKINRKNGGHFLSNLPLLEGNMLYLISILVVEYLDCQYRWKFRTSSPNLMRYFDIKFVLLLCTWFALWAIFELY